MDKNKYTQVIRNLLSNALKFCRKPGIVKVEVDLVPVSAYNGIEHNTRHVYSSRVCNVCNFRTSEKITIDESTHYLRISVTDDGAGISEVLKKYLNIIEDLFMEFLLFSSSSNVRKIKLNCFVVSFNLILVNCKTGKVLD